MTQESSAITPKRMRLSRTIRTGMTITVLVIGIVSLLFGWFMFGGVQQVQTISGGVICFVGGIMLAGTLRSSPNPPPSEELQPRRVDVALLVVGIVVVGAVVVSLVLHYLHK